ncbi:hypothetical protein KKE18_02710 [Patescibacteria group bacterium]|nr:hypothetical protein [Patescibacteria group bacterium]MBU0922691.1 hypothetical protein [Patescibacteria group bacterium]MBU1844997.1 hypothetical protein [Patescibacteria group bacterium]
MRERMLGNDSVDRVDEREEKLRQLNIGYLRGEISLEDYFQGCRENENRIDFRRIVAWQSRRAREGKIEDKKRRIKNFARKVLKLP